jgi:serine/threonine protein kinase/cytochrome c-type biogenesis protein CcmH/NrfG
MLFQGCAMSSPTKHPKQIFLDAVERYAPDQWPDYLNQACGGDADLRRRVEVLLAAHVADQSLLDSPAIAPPATILHPRSEAINTVIGPYTLLQQIGEGGMGTVYLAEQRQPVERRVALKVIKPGMDSRQVIARFEAEQQALALMDHPNIAKVLDAGTTDAGRPYFVMELVAGVPITRYCDEQHLTPRQRLELFVEVCQAVQHAHQKGIIHRDLKPSNVLIAMYDGQPVPKVIDFGVAKATGHKLADQTMFTELGQVVGTLEYMSPEQAEVNQLDIDTRSDIYSLGVLLYELLTGTTPFEKKRLNEAALVELLRIIREEEPPRPSTRLSTTAELASIAANRGLEPKRLSGLVRGDLDWIVMKALDKDRSRRYETANDFAADVLRYLEDEPVSACPPSAAYRLRKFARRNKVVLATVSMVAAALVAGVIGTTWQAIRATHAAERARTAEALAEQRYRSEKSAREQAEAARSDADHARQAAVAARNDAETARDRSDENLRLALEALDKISISAASEWLPRVSETGGRDLALIQEALKFYEAFGARNEDDPTVQWEVGRAYWRIGWLYRGVGRLTEAEAAYERAITVLDRLTVEVPDNPRYREYLTSAHLHLGLVLRDADCLPQAEQAFRECVTLRERLVADYPAEHRYRSSLANSLGNLAELLQSTRRFEEAGRSLERSVELLEELHQEFPRNREYLGILGRWLSCRGNFLRQSGSLDEAERDYRRSLTYREQLAAASDSREIQYDVVRTCSYLADLLLSSDQFADAERVSRQALVIDQRLAELYPGVPLYRNTLVADQKRLEAALSGQGKPEDEPDSLETTTGLAASYASRGAHADAAALYEQLLPLQKAKLGPDHATTLRSMGNLASNYNNLGRYGDAIKLYEQLLPLQKAKLGSDHATTLRSMGNLASIYTNLGRYGDAIKLYEQLLPLQKDKFGLAHPTTLHSMGGLAYSYHNHRRYADAITLAEELLPLQKATFGPNHRDTLRGMARLALSYHNSGGYAAAARLLEETVALQKAHFGPDHRDTLITMSHLARTYVSLRRHVDAVQLLEELIPLQKIEFGVENFATLSCMDRLAGSYAALERHGEAITLYEESLSLKRAHHSAKHGVTFQAMYGLAGSYIAVERPADAVELASQLVEVQPKVADYRSLLGRSLWLSGHWPEAITACEEAVQLEPDNERHHSNLALWLTTCPESEFRNPARALAAARKAVDIAPDSVRGWQILGWAHYRSGNWKSSIAALEKSCQLQGDVGDAGQWFVLALAHGKLAGQAELPEEERGRHNAEARTWFDKAVESMEQVHLTDEYIRGFRGEAVELLKLEDRSVPKRDDSSIRP